MKHSKDYSNEIRTLRRLALTALIPCMCVSIVDARRDAAELKALEDSIAEHQKQLVVQSERVQELNKQNESLRHLIAEQLERLSVLDNSYVVTNTAPRYLDIPLDHDLQDYVWSLCCEYGVEEMYEIMYAVIKQESQFDPTAISSTNDYGLMQINKSNHTWLSSELGIVDFLDPYENIHAGVYMLSSLIHKYDFNLNDALMAYNMGERNAGKLWRRGVHTTPYTEQVLDYYNQFIENI